MDQKEQVLGIQCPVEPASSSLTEDKEVGPDDLPRTSQLESWRSLSLTALLRPAPLTSPLTPSHHCAPVLPSLLPLMYLYCVLQDSPQPLRKIWAEQN